MQPQPLFVFLQSEAGSKPRGSIIASEIGKYIVSLGLKVNLLN